TAALIRGSVSDDSRVRGAAHQQPQRGYGKYALFGHFWSILHFRYVGSEAKTAAVIGIGFATYGKSFGDSSNQASFLDRPPELVHNLHRISRSCQVILLPCQGKVEMSPSRQNRNVPFSLDLGGVHVNLRVPVKRRRAMLASNPIKEWPAGTHRGRWAGRVLPARPIAWPGPDREAGPPHQ